jgi:hypothetical protein
MWRRPVTHRIIHERARRKCLGDNVGVGGRDFGCRHCYRLTYASCQASRKHTGLARFMAREMGMDFEAAKRMLREMSRRHL